MATFLDARQVSYSRRRRHLSHREGEVRWVPPTLPYVKINVDASWDVATGNGYAGAVVRDFLRNFLAARHTKLRATCVDSVEALAM